MKYVFLRCESCWIRRSRIAKGADKGRVAAIPWAMQVRARAFITRMPTSHPNSMATQHYSIVKYSFSITKKESSNEGCIVMFLTEKSVQIVIFSSYFLHLSLLSRSLSHLRLLRLFRSERIVLLSRNLKKNFEACVIWLQHYSRTKREIEFQSRDTSPNLHSPGNTGTLQSFGMSTCQQ